MRKLLSVIAITVCFVGTARAQEPRECDDGTRTTVTGTIQDTDHGTVHWVLWMGDDQRDECIIDVIILLAEPPSTCRVGRKVTATGKVLSSVLTTDLVDVESFQCE